MQSISAATVGSTLNTFYDSPYRNLKTSAPTSEYNSRQASNPFAFPSQKLVSAPSPTIATRLNLWS